MDVCMDVHVCICVLVDMGAYRCVECPSMYACACTCLYKCMGVPACLWGCACVLGACTRSGKTPILLIQPLPLLACDSIHWS